MDRNIGSDSTVALRCARRRYGSALILAVVLLMLLAVIAMAYLASSRQERVTSIQSQATQQVEHNVNGVIDTLQQLLLDDLHGRGEAVAPGSQQTPRYLPPSMTSPETVRDLRVEGPFAVRGSQHSPPPAERFRFGSTGFRRFESPGRIRVPLLDSNGVEVGAFDHHPDPWMADRLPTFIPNFTGDVVPPGGGQYAWRWISQPFTSRRFDDTTWWYDDPFGGSFVAPRHDVLPHVDAGDALDRWGPKLMFYDGSAWVWRRAADADGDGIADSFFSRLDGPTTNGLTTYVAWRVVDNLAAVNAAVAFEHTHNGSGNATGANFFPVNIGLADPVGPDPTKRTSMISRTGSHQNGNELLRLQAFRAPHPINANAWAVNLTDPVADDGNTIYPDFEFRDAYDAMWHQLGRRLDLPGFNFRGTTYRRLPVSDTLALAHGFVIGTPGMAGSSTLESLLPWSTQPHLDRPYTPANMADIRDLWGDVNFADRPTDAHANAGTYNVRPLLVTSNPVSKAAPVHLSRRWKDKWGHEHRVPFHPAVRNPGASNPVLAPDMLDYDLPSFYRGYWRENVEYTPGDIVRVGDRTYLCVATKDPAFPGLAGNINKNPAELHTIDQARIDAVAPYWEYQPFTRVPMKASLNTATFRELYRAFWNVICDETDPDRHPLSSPPFFDDRDTVRAAAGYKPAWEDNAKLANLEGWRNSFPDDALLEQDNVGQMFRSSIRDHRAIPRIRLNGKNQALLRAALAAVNTIDLRDRDTDITSRTITLEAEVYESPTVSRYHPVKVDVFGQEPQPFITRVYVNGNASGSLPNGFVAIELFNPYTENIPLWNWSILLLERPPAGSANLREIRKSTTATTRIAVPRLVNGAPYSVPAGGHLLLTNAPMTSAPDDINRSLPFGTTVIQLNGLHQVCGHEFVIVCSRTSRSGPSSNAYDQYDEPANDTERVPLDQHDLTGYEPRVTVTDASTGRPVSLPTVYYYSREHTPGTDLWQCPLGGRYYPERANRPELPVVSNGAVDRTKPDVQGETRHEGARYFATLNGDSATIRIKLGFGSSALQFTTPSTASDSRSARFPPVQLNNLDFPGFHDPVLGTNWFPFGGFPRVGDVLMVPFVGSYRIRLKAHNDLDRILEMNSISMDLAFVCDRNKDNDAREHLGRFCPIPDDMQATVAGVTRGVSYYDWAKDIFDHFTAIAPYDDQFPNIMDGPPTGVSPTHYVTYGQPYPEPYHVATKFLPSTTEQDQAAEQGVEGLININTAPWRVLATVPWTTGSNAQRANYAIAKAIVRHRELHGPFSSIMDLMTVQIDDVPGVADAPVRANAPFWQQLPDVDLDDEHGDFSPYNDSYHKPASPLDGVRGDFEEQFLMLTRVSNPITTRSDSFTAFICLQQWEYAGTPEARMVAKRRYAVLFDRSGIIKDKKDVKVSYIPID